MGDRYKCPDCKQYFRAYPCHVCHNMEYERCYWCHFDFFNSLSREQLRIEEAKRKERNGILVKDSR